MIDISEVIPRIAQATGHPTEMYCEPLILCRHYATPTVRKEYLAFTPDGGGVPVVDLDSGDVIYGYCGPGSDFQLVVD